MRIKGKVSIIMPTYNRAFCLWKAILSIQSQTYTDWELIVVDDRSTDDTYKLVREFKADSRIKYFINNGKHSAAGARQTGLEIADGDYIAYLDSDNTVSSNWLATMVDRLKRYPEAVFAYPDMNFSMMILEGEDYKVVRETSKYAFEPTVENLWNHKFEGDPNGLVHLGKARKHLKWDLNLSLYEDYDYSLQLASKYPNGMLYIPLALVNYVRLYGEAGVCNDVNYSDIIKNLKYLKKKYAANSLWTQSNWYDELIGKYEVFAAQGKTPRERIVEKYGSR